MRSDRERLLDVQQAIERVERHTQGNRRPMERDALLQDAVLRNLQIIGEAVRSLSAELKDAHPEVPWSEIIGMRHVLVHGYFDIDLAVVNEVIEHGLPDLKRRVAAILEELGADAADG